MKSNQKASEILSSGNYPKILSHHRNMGILVFQRGLGIWTVQVPRMNKSPLFTPRDPEVAFYLLYQIVNLEKIVRMGFFSPNAYAPASVWLC